MNYVLVWWPSSGLLQRCLQHSLRPWMKKSKGGAQGCLSEMPRASSSGTLPAEPRAFALLSSHSGEREKLVSPPRPSPRGRPGSPPAPPGHPTSGDRRRQPHLGRLRPAVAGSGSPSPATTPRGKPAIPALPSDTLPWPVRKALGEKDPLPPRAGPAELARGPRT